MIRVLIVAEATERNTFISNLSAALTSHCEIEIGVDKFWKSEKKYDIIHFHWPEHLSHRIKRKSLPPLPWRFNKIKARIQFLKTQGAKLVLTRHNTQSHEYEQGFKKLYNYLNTTVDGVIHMGSYSIQEYHNLYPQIKNKNVLIPHGWYDDIPNTISKEEARQKLNLNPNSFVVLAFGAFRKQKEEKFVIEAFKKLKQEDKRLLIPRGFYHNDKLIFRLFDYLNLAFYRQLIQGKKNELASHKILWDQQFTPKENIQDYFNAADVILIPRLKILNSGNVPLAFYFKKLVIGPRDGNVGSILEETGNLTFDVKDSNSLVEALLTANKASGKGLENYDYAKKKWNWEIIAKQHLDFYTSLF